MLDLYFSVCFISFVQSNTFLSYMDGAPVSYQLWNNYLIKHRNYRERLLPRNKMWAKSLETIIKLNEEVTYAMKAIQPQPEKGMDCVIMITYVLAQPDWINIPCFQKIPTFVVCQMAMKQRQGSRLFTTNNSQNRIEICQNNSLLIENRCISLRKYNNHMNLSKIKYDTNYIGNTKIMSLEKEILFQYFTMIQHVYIKPLQFIISIPFNSTYLYYKPYQTTNFSKLTWKSKMSNNPVTGYDGYVLSTNQPLKIIFPSNVFKCEDGSYIAEISICDGKSDCTEGSDEHQCTCHYVTDLLPVGCKYFCNEMSDHCTCSDFYFTCLSSSICIPYLKVCDGHRDCLYGEDEYCGNHTDKEIKTVVSGLPVDTFTCTGSNTTIPANLWNDFIPDCPDTIEDEIQYYNLMTNPFHIPMSCNNNQKLSCIPGHSHCFYLNKLCVFEFQQSAKILKHCRNVAHLYNCTKFQCSGYFKCPMSYCIPFDLICNGEWDCPEGDDEVSCLLM